MNNNLIGSLLAIAGCTILWLNGHHTSAYVIGGFFTFGLLTHFFMRNL